MIDPLEDEYESTCEYMAKRGRKGEIGDALPSLLSETCRLLIESDLEAFQDRIKDHAYALAMSKLNLSEEL